MKSEHRGTAGRNDLEEGVGSSLPEGGEIRSRIEGWPGEGAPREEGEVLGIGMAWAEACN